MCGLAERVSWRGKERVGALAEGCSGLAGRRRERGNVLWYEGMGEVWPNSSAKCSVRSSSACSGMLGSMLRLERGYASSIALRRGERLRPALRGEAGLRGAEW